MRGGISSKVSSKLADSSDAFFVAGSAAGISEKPQPEKDSILLNAERYNLFTSSFDLHNFLNAFTFVLNLRARSSL